jgi:DNA-binding LacI/PurR family transcriptional regulator
VYLQNELIQKMECGELLPAGRIPSENELCRTYGVSTLTARRALSDLVYSGKIVRIKGKGSFVAPLKADLPSRLRPASTGIVSLVLLSYEPSDSSIIEIIKGAQEYISARGYSMTVECSDLDAAREAEIIDKCIKNGVDGLLMFSTDPDANRDKFAAIQTAGIPLVMLDRATVDFPCTLVCSYHLDGMYQVTRYLTRKGHRNIAFITAGRFTSVHAERLAGYRAALEQNAVPFREELCLLNRELEFSALERLIRDHGVTAAACINDRTGIAVKQFLVDRGFRVPEDISVTGFDDNEGARYADLTTVRQHFRDIGEAGAQKLLEQIRDGASCSRIFFPVELVVRGSTAEAR